MLRLKSFARARGWCLRSRRLGQQRLARREQGLTAAEAAYFNAL